MRNISEIIIHCSATPEGRDVSVEQIRRWHVQRGYKDIGYHYIIGIDGHVYEGRPIDTIGAHCVGHNTNSIGICYIGGMNESFTRPKDTRTHAQILALRNLIAELHAKYPNARVYGHREFNRNKACPSFDVHTCL